MRPDGPILETEMDDYGCSAAVLTAVEIETKSVRDRFSGWKRVSVPGDRQEYYKTVFERGGIEHSIVTAQQAVMGMTAATLLATKMIYEFRPRYLIMCGIAAGIGDEAEEIYGDVIVPDMIWDYSTGKYVGPDESEIRFGDLGFLPRPVSVKPDSGILDIIKAAADDPENEFHIHVGPMACGSCVVANTEMVDKQIRALFPKTLGLDMESYSVCFAAESASDPKPKPVVIKSICDYANSEKSDMYQKFAAYTSSGFLKYLLENKLEF